MKLTRVIAIGVILGSIGLSVSDAQTLRQAEPPAEFPPASYTGKQFVDSRGCVYIRAGIDGNVTWVPRVSQSRKQLCGYQPTAIAGGAPARAPAQSSVEVITVAPTAAPTPATVAAPRPAPAPAPRQATVVPAPPRTAAPSAARPRVVLAPAPGMATGSAGTRPPAVTTYKPSPQPATTPAPAIAPRAATGCSNASGFSQQFINGGARCGPQKEAPITYGRGWNQSSLNSPGGSHRRGAAGLPENTRVVPRHVYEKRQNTIAVMVPAGYRPAWDDDRLNPHRAERGLAPAELRIGLPVPAGFRAVERKDDRLNQRRLASTATGDAQTNMIWTQTVPRTLVPVATAPQIVVLSESARRSQAEMRYTGVFQ